MEVVREVLENIEYASNWPKAIVVNFCILSSLEIRTIQRIINERNIPYENIRELEFIDVRVSINGSTIIYTLNLPTTRNITCELIRL